MVVTMAVGTDMVDMDMAVDMDMVGIVTSVRDLLMPSLLLMLLLLLMPMLMPITAMVMVVDTEVISTARDLLTLMPKLLLLLMRMLMLTTVMDTDVDTMVDITAVVMEDTVTAEDTTGDK